MPFPFPFPIPFPIPFSIPFPILLLILCPILPLRSPPPPPSSSRLTAPCFASTPTLPRFLLQAPCYKAVEATRHLKAFLEPKGLYNYDARPILTAAWQTAKNCHFVEATTGAQYFKSLRNAK